MLRRYVTIQEGMMSMGDDQLYHPRSKSTYEMMHTQLKQMAFTFMDWVAHWRGRYACPSPSTKALQEKGG